MARQDKGGNKGGVWGAGSYPSCVCVKAGTLPGQVATLLQGHTESQTTISTQTHTSGQSRVQIHLACMLCWIVCLFCGDGDLYCLLSGSCYCPLHLKTTGTRSKWKWICSYDVLGIDYGNRQICQNVELPLSHCKKTMVMKGPFNICCSVIQSIQANSKKII